METISTENAAGFFLFFFSRSYWKSFSDSGSIFLNGVKLGGISGCFLGVTKDCGISVYLGVF